MMNLYNLHHDERYWEDPWEFRPERFLTEDGEVVPLNHIKRMRYITTPYYYTEWNYGLELFFLFFY